MNLIGVQCLGLKMNDLMKLAFSFKYLSGELSHLDSVFSDSRIAQLGQKILTDVKEAHGTYRYGWAPLSPVTIADKGEDTPLYTTGELAESYEARIMDDPSGNGKALVIGSPEDKALWHELGYFNVRTNDSVPARPVLMPSINANEAEIKDVFGHVMIGLFSQAWNSSSGDLYDIQTIEYKK